MYELWISKGMATPGLLLLLLQLIPVIVLNIRCISKGRGCTEWGKMDSIKFCPRIYRSRAGAYVTSWETLEIWRAVVEWRFIMAWTYAQNLQEIRLSCKNQIY